MDLNTLVLGMALGVFLISKTEQARMKKYASTGKSSQGTLEVHRPGGLITEHIVDFRKPDLMVGKERYKNNPEKVYIYRGVQKAFANEGSIELIDMTAQARNEKLSMICPSCKKVTDFDLQTIWPIPDPKGYNDIVMRAISWGMTALQDKNTQKVLLAVGAAILVGAGGAFFGFQAVQKLNEVITNQQVQGMAIDVIKNATMNATRVK